jgi:phosphoglycerol transferase MdoB-like AlkP superfamily enzyme
MNEMTKQNPAGTPQIADSLHSAKGFLSAVGVRIRGALGDSKSALVRAGLLFLVLFLIKLVMLVSFRKHLLEIHWRIGSQPFTYTNAVLFYAFAALVGLNLWLMATRCVAAGIRVVRPLNACILLLGAMFIVLTFHEGNKNYLHPLLHGVLPVKALGWYFACNLFFRSPYLAGWIFVYAIVYYVLVRTRREHVVLRLTAICATSYIALYLGDLSSYYDALVTVDCFGIVCLVCAAASSRGLGLGWTALYLLGTLFTFIVFAGSEIGWTLGRMDAEFVILSGSSLCVLVGVTLFAWRRNFLSYWSWILPFAVTSFLLLTNVNYPFAANYNNLLCTGLTISRYFLGDLLVTGVLLALALVYRRCRPSGSLWWVDLICLLLICVALMDLRLTQIMGARLDWQALSLALGETPKMMWRMAKPYLPLLFTALALITVLFVVLARKAEKTEFGMHFRNSPRLFSGVGFFVLSFLLLGWAGQRIIEHDKAGGQAVLVLAESSPMWRHAISPVMDKTTFTEKARSLGMSEMLKSKGGATQRNARDLNVVLIFQESTYNKYLSLFGGKEETQPMLSKYKDRMEIFPNFFSSFAGSINARFATFTGLYPVQDYKSFTLERIPVKSIFELLHDQGYSCSLFYSSFFDYTGFRDFLRGREIEELYDADTMPGERKAAQVSWGLHEEDTLAAIQGRIDQYASRNQKFFLTYIPAAPHNPFDGTPAQFCKYKRQKVKDLTPLYLNELLYMDYVISSIVEHLEKSGLLDKTVVVITSDHGELLGDDGGRVGHGWAVNPELANIPLIVMNPGNVGYHVNPIVGSQVDLLPSLLDILGVALPHDRLYQGSSLYSLKPESDRTIFLSSFNQYGIIRNQHFIYGERGLPEEGLHKDFIIGGSEITNEAGSIHISDVPSMTAFDRFQENFLRNYSQYCEFLK